VTASAATGTAVRPVRDRLLDAAAECLGDRGIRATTVSEVAARAGVSRGWLYRHFPDKAELLGAAIVRLNDAFWAQSRRQLDALDDLVEQITLGVALARQESETPGALVLALRRAEPEAFAACVGVGVRGLLPEIAAFWSGYVRSAVARGEIRSDTDCAEAAEWIARALVSLATVPGEHCDVGDPASVRHHVRRYVVAALRAESSD
jgi:AcrR family transcriptional regulator